MLPLAIILVGMINFVSGNCRQMTGQGSAFQDAATVFDVVTHTVSEATLKTCLDYYPPQSMPSPALANATPPPPPSTYIRYSDLHFVAEPAKGLIASAAAVGIDISPSHAVFFQAPLDYTKTNAKNLPADYSNVASLLTGCGYYVTYSKSTPLGVPKLSADSKKRFRFDEILRPDREPDIRCTNAFDSSRANV